jgi:hypothetical protein
LSAAFGHLRPRLSNQVSKFGSKSFSNCLQFHIVHFDHINRSTDGPQLSAIGDFAFDEIISIQSLFHHR